MKKPKEIFKNIHQHLVYNSAIVALVSFLWLVLRSGLNPKRVVYPCQQAAAANVSLFGIPLFSTVLAKVRRRQKWSLLRLFLGVSAMAVLLLASGLAYQGYQRGQRERRASKLFLNSWEAKAANTSEIFVVQHIPKPSGDNHPGVDALINLMSQKGRDFYSLISSGDVVVIKVNGQWEQRGGTNTDVLKGLIYRIVNRPGGFSGEIVVADNTQYRGGNLDWGSQNNAEDHDQSAVDVANYFSGLGHKVSTYGWINIRTTQVSEYDQRDSRDGYVYDAGFDVSYPKFSTPYNIKISLKKGIWNGSSYDSQRLKLINLPVLKTHGALGVTAALKHFVGFYSTALHSNHHWEIWNSQAILAREMVHVRMPVLHLIDAIYVGAIDAGPYISYGEATAANVLLASPDPVALDYYAGKNILHPLNPNNARTDPDYQDGSFANPCPGGGSNGYPGYPCNAFHQTLVSSRNYFNSHGYTTTMNEAEMNIHVYDFQGQPTLTPTPISTPTPTPTPSAKDPDLDKNGQVNAADMKQLLTKWGLIASIAAEDLDSNGRVNSLDAGRIVANWTGGPPASPTPTPTPTTSPPSTGEFEYYGVKFSGVGDSGTLSPLGVNLYLLVFDPGASEESWRAALNAAAAQGLRTVVWLWGGGGVGACGEGCGHVWQWDENWNGGQGRWDLSKGERFLTFAKNYVAQNGTSTLYAIYGPHEIYNYSKWQEGVGVEPHRELYRKLKSHPNWPGGVKIYGRVWDDYDQDVPWVSADQETFTPEVCDICMVKYTPFYTDGRFERDKYIADLARDRRLIHDKGNSKFVPMAPAFGEGQWRMPTKGEMREAGQLACDVQPDGIMWYVWAHGGYTGYLSNRSDLWPVIGEIYGYCR